MKKYLFLAATAIVALASCSDNSLVGEGVVVPVENELTPITFSSTSAVTTRDDLSGKAAATKLNNNFVVEGVKWNGTGGEGDAKEVVYDHYNVNWVDNSAYTTTSNTNGWEYVGQEKHAYGPAGNQVIKFWDYAKSQYDFIAYSVGTADADYSTNDYSNTKVKISEIDATKMNGVKTDNVITDGAYTIKGTKDNLAKVYIADLFTAYRDNTTSDYTQVVKLKFRSLSSKVRIGLYETVPGYSITNVKFYTADATEATDDNAHLFGTKAFNDEGTYIVYYPTTGSNNKEESDYNKAHLKFNPLSTTAGTVTVRDFGARDAATNVVRENKETDNATAKLYISHSSGAPTYYGPTANDAHHYTVVAPNEDGAVLNLKVNYTLLATDGSGEVINVTGATAKVPAQYAQWKSGYAYTYLFKISENTNGKTNPNIGVTGLYPITFDAVVMNDEVDGIQETITTVSEPSITTFGVKSGKFTTGTDEYESGTTIYVTCLNADGSVFDPTLGGNTHIYRVTSADETNFPITEASVAESQQHPAGNKITVTHECCGYNSAAKVTSVPAEDGNTKTINAIKFTPVTTANKVFAVRYTTTNPVVSGYSEGTVLTAGTSLEGYYRDKFEQASGTAVADVAYYEKTEIKLGKVLPAGTLLDGYYTDAECNTACTTGTEANGETTYYFKVDKYEDITSTLTIGGVNPSSVTSYYIINGKEACGDAEWANGVNKYYTPTYSTAPGFTYKIIRVKK